MRKYVPLLLFLLIGWAPTVSSAQVLAQGPIIAASQSVVATNLAPATSFSFQIGNTFSQTLTFQASADCTNYVSLLVTSVTDGSTGTTATASGIWSAANAGYLCVRVFGTSYTSGRADVWIMRGYSQAKIASPQFSNVVANSLCMSAATQDSYITEAILGANNPGVYSGGTNCAGGTLRWDWNASRIKFSYPVQLSDGTAAAPSLTFASTPDMGLYRLSATSLGLAVGGTGRLFITGTTSLQSQNNLIFGSDSNTIALGAAADVILARDAANTLAQKNGSNVQFFRVYGSTTQYTQISHNGTNAQYGTTVGHHVFDSQIDTVAGTTALAQLSLTNGPVLSSPTANAVENDGVSRYFTHDVTNGRKVDDEWNFFELTGAGTGITTIADFFGATGSGIPLVSGGRYEIEWHCVFAQATAGTATWTIVTATTALAILDAHYVGSNIAGIGAVGAPQQAGVNTTASSSTALPVTGTEATAVTHMFDIHAIVTAGAGAGNTRLRLAMSAGTATPQAGSYFKVRRLPAANTGTFVS